MISVDTNVIVRLLTNDDPKQVAVASRLVASNPIWIPKTVLLETIWVLRSQYGFANDAIREGLMALLGVENVHVEDQREVVAALILTASGVDFADALHVCSRPPTAAFASFDKAFIRQAKRAGVGDISAI